MKKVVASIAALTLLLTGCSSGGSEGGDTGGKKVLQVQAEENQMEFYNAVEAEFEAANPDIDVEFVEAGMFDIVDSLATKKGNTTDVFMVPNDRIGDLSQQKLIAPITADISKYTETAQTAASFDGSNYMVPMSTDTTLLFYNKNVTTEEPATLSELSATEFAAKWTDFYVTAGMFYSNGGYIFGDDNTNVEEIGLANEGSVVAGEAIKKLYASGDSTWVALKEETSGYEVMIDDFVNGRKSYIIDGPWKVADFEKAGLTGDKLGYMVIPSWDGTNEYKPLAGTKGLAVNAYSAEAEEAQKFVEFVATKDWATKWHETTKEVNPHTEVVYEDGSLASVVLKATESATSMPNDPAFGKVWVPMADALKQIANGGDVQPSLEAAKTVIDQDIASME